MSFMESGDDLSEDGELRQSPSESRHKTAVPDLRLVLRYNCLLLLCSFNRNS